MTKLIKTAFAAIFASLALNGAAQAQEAHTPEPQVTLTLANVYQAVDLMGARLTLATLVKSERDITALSSKIKNLDSVDIGPLKSPEFILAGNF